MLGPRLRKACSHTGRLRQESCCSVLSSSPWIVLVIWLHHVVKEGQSSVTLEMSPYLEDLCRRDAAAQGQHLRIMLSTGLPGSSVEF